MDPDDVPRAHARALLRQLSGERLLLLAHMALEVSRLDYDRAWALLQIAKRIGKAPERTQAIADANRGEVECRTAEEVLDARIASVVALVLRGEVRGRKLVP